MPDYLENSQDFGFLRSEQFPKDFDEKLRLALSAVEYRQDFGSIEERLAAHAQWVRSLLVSGPVLGGRGLFRQQNLSGKNFRNLELRGADFSKCNLAGADFCGANLQFVNFSEANLVGANFAGCDLRGANLSNACMDEVNFDGSLLKIDEGSL